MAMCFMAIEDSVVIKNRYVDATFPFVLFFGLEIAIFPGVFSIELALVS
jgi:hypothetical protein